MYEDMNSTADYPMNISREQVSAYVNKVYLWMAATLLITAGVAAYATTSQKTIAWVAEHMTLMSLGMIGLVLVMSFGASRLTSGALGVLLLTFSAVEGLLFGPILIIYTQTSVATAFAVTAGMFGVMAVYGAITKRDLSGMGRTLMMMLFGLIIAGVVNIFWGNGMMQLLTSGIGVVVFALFTAYDMQNILKAGLYVTDEEQRNKGAIMGALALYLDFINLFLYLLRLLGDRRD